MNEEDVRRIVAEALVHGAKAILTWDPAAPVVPIAPVPEPIPETAEINSNGVTWKLSEPRASGTFVTGDPWIIGPATIASVTPAFDGTKNGTMVDPDPASNKQGYDTRVGGLKYDDSLRAVFPLDVDPSAGSGGVSVISSIGKAAPTTGGGATKIDGIGILTVLDKAPPANSFRPQYMKGEKRIYTTDDVDWSLLPGLPVPDKCTVMDFTKPTNYLNRVWLDHGNINTQHAQIFPDQHCLFQSSSGGYPYHRALELGRMALLALTDHPEAKNVATRLIQYGIDLTGSMEDNGMTWSRQAGFGVGRKWPLLFAETMLDAADWPIPFFASGMSGVLKFQEDDCTYFGPDGVPRWGEICTGPPWPGTFAGSNHTCRPSKGDVDQYAMKALGGPEGEKAGAYEVCCNPRGFIGPALAARLLDHRWQDQHPAFFAYTDRFVDSLADEMVAAGHFTMVNDYQEDANKYGGDGNGFMMRMWEKYR